MKNARCQSIFTVVGVAAVTLFAARSFADPPPPPMPDGRVKVQAAPQQTGMNKLAPAGTTTGSTTPQANLIPKQIRSVSPTPPGFPFGAPGGSWAPAGPPNSGSVPAFTIVPPQPGGSY